MFETHMSKPKKGSKLSLAKDLCKGTRPQNSVKARVGDRRNTVEEKKALRTCQELLAVCVVSILDQARRHDGGFEYSQTQRNVPITILVKLLKNIRHALQTDTSLHE